MTRESARVLSIKLTSERGHWRIQMHVDGEIEPSAIFGCRGGLAPVLRALVTADAQVTAVRADPLLDVRGTEPTVTVTMPSGRHLTFALRDVQEAPPDVPEARGAIRGSTGEGEPIDVD